MIVPDVLLANDDEEARGFTLSPLTSFSHSFSLLSAAGVTLGPNSSAVPGVFGVFTAEPKEANAPVPRPKAEEAPVVGEAMPVVVDGEMALKGLDLPCEDESPPNRLAAAKVRGESDFVLSLLGVGFEVVRESLLELKAQKLEMLSGIRRHQTYFERRCQRLSMRSELSVFMGYLERRKSMVGPHVPTNGLGELKAEGG